MNFPTWLGSKEKILLVLQLFSLLLQPVMVLGQFESTPDDFLGFDYRVDLGPGPERASPTARMRFYYFAFPHQDTLVYLESQLGLQNSGIRSYQQGAILRFHNPRSNAMSGASVFYDYRHGSFGGFHELGLGLEHWSTFWAVSLNAYLPFGASSHTGARYYWDDYVGDYWVKAQLKELAYFGWDTFLHAHAFQGSSIGVWIWSRIYQLFHPLEKPGWGAGVGVKTEFEGGGLFELALSCDEKFGTHFAVILGFHLALFDGEYPEIFHQSLWYRRSEIPTIKGCFYQTSY